MTKSIHKNVKLMVTDVHVDNKSGGQGKNTFLHIKYLFAFIIILVKSTIRC